MDFQPDYRHFEDVMNNRRPGRLPIYEHLISESVMEEILDVQFSGLRDGDERDQAEFFRHYCGFFRHMTYDTVSFEICIGDILPGQSALSGGKGAIQTRQDFDNYPWKELPGRYWQMAGPRFDALIQALPPGMKAVGGVGHGVFELAESLVGLQYLPFIQIDAPALYADLFRAVGDLMCEIWNEFMTRYAQHFAACRFGDDLGFRSSLLTNPGTVRTHIVPQYRRLLDIIHGRETPFLWHSCGCIFEVMEDFIQIGIDAKHSNEDAIAPFERWIADYGDRIGLLGGFDMDFLCSRSPDIIREKVIESGRRFMGSANGYALGSGNSIPDYVPVENYLAMVDAAQHLRSEQQQG